MATYAARIVAYTERKEAENAVTATLQLKKDRATALAVVTKEPDTNTRTAVSAFQLHVVYLRMRGW